MEAATKEPERRRRLRRHRAKHPGVNYLLFICIIFITKVNSLFLDSIYIYTINDLYELEKIIFI